MNEGLPFATIILTLIKFPYITILNMIKTLRKGQRFFLMLLLVTGSINLKAQQTAIWHDPEFNYKLAYELFVKEKYSAAKKEFEKALQNPDLPSASRQNAQYYMAVCSAELYHTDGEKILEKFIEENPQSIKTPLAHFQLGRIYFKQKQYAKAIDNFEKADVFYLKNDEVTEYYFKTGYAYFSKKNYDAAAKQFRQITGVESKYKTAAQYYYAHTAYEKNNSKEALEYFFKLKDSETFSPLVPLYISQIYFEQQKYDELLDYAIPVIEKEKTQNKNEIRRVIAETYYKKGQYQKALNFFEDYAKNTPVLNREDNYQIGYAYYKLQQFEKASTYLKKVTDVKDALAQNAYFVLGDCFVQAANKQSARSAFESASKMDYEKELKEEAQFNFAKLTYELNYQTAAIRTLNDFLKTYPQSKHKDEINELLGNIYLGTRNYKDAIESLDKIQNKTATVKAAYQKVTYYRGTQFYNDRDFDKAIGMFTKSIVNKTDEQLAAQAGYWKAEALYNQNKYDDAIKQYRIFIFSPASLKLDNYNTGNYNIAYCYYKKKNYGEAATWFRKYTQNKEQTDNARYNDALMRIADSYFVTRDFANAESFYASVVNQEAKAGDYALFQKGIILGLRGNMAGKAQTMQQVIDRYPKSEYIDDATFEKGNALMASGNESEAKPYFNKVINSYGQSPYVKKSLLNTGLIYYNEKNDADALRTFKQVISKYPGTAEASEALTQIKNIYVANGNPDTYFEYIKTVPFANVSSGAQDSITYEAAEQRFMKGDYTASGKDFETYLRRFPQGYFVLNATFYKAECDFKAKSYDNAIKGFESVTEKDRNIFTERSLLRLASIYYVKKDYTKALENYSKLESSADYKDNIIASYIGQMRCSYYLNKCNEAIAYSLKVLEVEQKDNSIQNEAHLIAARCAIKADDLTTAQKEFSVLAKQGSSAITAEAKYSLALIQFKLSNYKDSQKKCFEVIKELPSYDFWNAKCFILLADNYYALKDNFQAKQTLKSIIENYEKSVDDTEDIKVIAQQKLDVILQSEKETSNKEILEKQHLNAIQNDSLEIGN